MPFLKPLPHWEAPGIEPPLSLRQGGWKAGVKPPDEYFNYLQNTSYEALKELQENAVHKDDVGSGVTNLGFRGLLADPVSGIGGPDHIDKYPEGLSVMYTDRTDWAVFLNMTDFISATEFLFVETNKTIQDGKVNATQQITRYKKESPAIPVKLISQYTRVWYSDASYTGWSNAEKVVFTTEFETHLADNEKHVTAAERTNWNGKAPASHSHTIAQVTGLQTALDSKIASSLINKPNGVAGLDGNGRVINADGSNAGVKTLYDRLVFVGIKVPANGSYTKKIPIPGDLVHFKFDYNRTGAEHYLVDATLESAKNNVLSTTNFLNTTTSKNWIPNAVDNTNFTFYSVNGPGASKLSLSTVRYNSATKEIEIIIKNTDATLEATLNSGEYRLEVMYN
ncbi:hypothetical protein [Psychrobacillus vulpis]|uniref:Uncharacterized protein n=1 Tax=Psychrobacillus vulpis TaxID=2325572 RepID=A0A544TWF8_9BACI|nr:hypothetical protein [Psychrobacillus vulpis]TQR21788.1 hypothetical protein FG384_02245 [Psychrobacillus vulpis]